MKTLLAVAAAFLACGCANTRAQNSGTLITEPGNMCSPDTKPCQCPDGSTATVTEIEATNPPMPLYSCPGRTIFDANAAPDGPPPRWVTGKKIPCPSGYSQSYCDGWDETEKLTRNLRGHWECTSGYVLDGFRVEWVDGNYKISPERCKAK